LCSYVALSLHDALPVSSVAVARGGPHDTPATRRAREPADSSGPLCRVPRSDARPLGRRSRVSMSTDLTTSVVMDRWRSFHIHYQDRKSTRLNSSHVKIS